MKVCAVFEVSEELSRDVDGECISIPRHKLLGYAVFDGEVMVSRIFSCFAAAQECQDHLEKERSAPLAPDFP